MKTFTYPDTEDLAAAVAAEIAESCATAVSLRGSFHLALSGGNTPQRCYEMLRQLPLAWTKTYIYFSDERCLPVGHDDRNDTMADGCLLSHVVIPASNIHRIPAELGPEAGALAYAEILTHAPVMDLLLLGMGEDGHTASLFPDNPALADERLAVPVFNAPKPPPERISMGYTVLNQARKRIVMVAGSGKKDALQRVQQGERLPVARLAACEWYVEEVASNI